MAAGRIQGIAGVLIWTERARFAEMARFYRDRVGLTPRTTKPTSSTSTGPRAG
jgi:hypothetical protein